LVSDEILLAELERVDLEVKVGVHGDEVAVVLGEESESGIIGGRAFDGAGEIGGDPPDIAEKEFSLDVPLGVLDSAERIAILGGLGPAAAKISGGDAVGAEYGDEESVDAAAV